MIEERITQSYPDLSLVKELYTEAFPLEERLPFDVLMDFVTQYDVDFTGYREDGQFVGFSYVYHHADLSWWFYFAVVPALRGKGLGAKILARLLEHEAGRCLVMDVEDPRQPDAPNHEQRTRRHAFYCRHGFADSGVTRSFRGITYTYMTRGGRFTDVDLATLFASLHWTP